ncbi:MAG: galactokinase [Deltaproteobacteria bacterium]|nr:galactokinase [Deltaproteobacteria bacterium]
MSSGADAFKARCGRFPIWRADAGGRVNLIGEHTDYHDGLVLPAAIDLRTVAWAAPRDDGRLRIWSESANDGVEVEVAALAPPETVSWTSYALGPFWAMQQFGLGAPAADILVQSSVPFGSGLSSSAAIEVALAGVGTALGHRLLEPIEIARLARHAENGFCRVPCGPMDQIASACGVAGHAILIDCRTLDVAPVALPPSWALVVADSGVRHSLATSEYRRRQAECAIGLHALRKSRPELRAARDVDIELLESQRDRLEPLSYRRLRHVVTENQRVRDVVAALAAGRHDEVGPLLDASHASLASDYQVSCPELDLLVELAHGIEGVLGSRLTGAGFGGNTVSLVRADRADSVCQQLAHAYAARTGRQTRVRVVRPAAGLKVERVSA